MLCVHVRVYFPVHTWLNKRIMLNVWCGFPCSTYIYIIQIRNMKYSLIINLVMKTIMIAVWSKQFRSCDASGSFSSLLLLVFPKFWQFTLLFFNYLEKYKPRGRILFDIKYFVLFHNICWKHFYCSKYFVFYYRDSHRNGHSLIL
jgi:hypothetical protein